MQSIILISAFIAGNNKEQTDIKIFETDQSKYRLRKGNAIEQKQGVNLLGKTRRFTLDRLTAIADYLSSLEIDGSKENKKINHSVEFYSCINSLVQEELLKKQVTRSAGHANYATCTGGDELILISFKCNYDVNFVQEVAEKIDFFW